MSTENKQTTQQELDSKQELVFIDKEKDCKECDKQKEITLSLGMVTIEEWEKIIPLLNKMTLQRQEVEYIYNFYNRVFGTKKQPGCAKCMKNIATHLKVRWSEMNK